MSNSSLEQLVADFEQAVKDAAYSDCSALYDPGNHYKHMERDDALTALMAAIRPSVEAAPKPIPCWCPYCNQPHSPRIQEADPGSPTKPCTCPDTTESACGVARGSQLGKLWHCRRSSPLGRGVE